MDFEVQRCTRHCAKTERELAPDEEFYAVLMAEGAEVVRYDYCADAWEGPPERSLGWWKSKMPGKDPKKLHWAPNDVMLDYFERLEGDEERRDIRYVLGLLLVRRRVARHEESERDEQDQEWLVIYCPRREATYKVAVVTPTPERTMEIQEELARLLFADAA